MEQALNIWADMYNKADKERFDLMLENGKLKQTLQEIKEICKQKLPAGLSAPSCYESFEAFTGYVLQKCEAQNEQ